MNRALKLQVVICCGDDIMGRTRVCHQEKTSKELNVLSVVEEFLMLVPWWVFFSSSPEVRF